jgi:uncharacterized protein
MQHPILSVADILGRPGEHRDLELHTALPGVSNALARLDDAPVRASLRAESVVEGVLVTGRVEATAWLECARCLATEKVDLPVDVCEMFVTGERASSEDDAYVLAGADMDLEPMLRDALGLALPLKPLCRDDCRGLCARCGKNLNAGWCDCTDDEMDPRWAALAAVRERLEG